MSIHSKTNNEKSVVVNSNGKVLLLLFIRRVGLTERRVGSMACAAEASFCLDFMFVLVKQNERKNLHLPYEQLNHTSNY